ncbi:MAG: hypothetical protein U0R76_14310 [Candidatus Nanopelagicales bacterium]
MEYQDGDIANGHRYDAATNAWVPLPAPPPPTGAPLPPPPSAPRRGYGAPCEVCGSPDVRLVRQPRDWLIALVAVAVLLGLLIVTNRLVTDAFGILGAALFGGVVGLAVFLPIGLARRYRCDQCGHERRGSGRGTGIERLSTTGIVIVELALAVVVVGMLLGAQRVAHLYPAASEKTFLSACEAGDGTKAAFCGCLLARVEQAYTYREFVSIDAAMAKGAALPADITAMAKACSSGA